MGSTKTQVRQATQDMQKTRPMGISAKTEIRINYMVINQNQLD